MQNIEIKVFDSLSPELEKQTNDLRYIAFHKAAQTPQQKALNDDKYSFREDVFGFVIGFIDNKPVGYIRLFKRPIVYNDKHILMGGIGGVCTSPDYQRRGIATKLLHVAMKELKKEQCDIAYLCTDIDTLAGLYGQVGFVVLPRAYTFTGKSGKKYTDTDGMIAPVNSDTIFQEILEGTHPFDLHGLNW